ncbi:5'/3'-nucleotidase sure family protein [Delphinella strobiligena]|nr:5'/3'-nucleotidase sure family protein [Delphinella strobiligena]
MHLSYTISLLPLAVQAANIVSTNDDGWAEMNIRTLYDTLTSSGNSVVLSAPAENKSGSDSLEATPTTVTDGCEYSSCPSDSPAYGHNSTKERLNYVNSYPVTAMKYGVQNLSTTYFDGLPDLLVSGPNVGSNLGIVTLFAGTIGAASAAADQLGVPGIAFSGATGSQTGWDVATPDYALIYADLATNVTNTLIEAGKPYLPTGTWLNVNFPAAGSGTSCTSASDFKFVLSRIHTATVFSGVDVVTCGDGDRLPTEASVAGTDGCYASISLGLAHNKLDATAAAQGDVLASLSKILSCLP